jgi:hypothetical protein
MIVKTKLAEIQEELAPHLEMVCMKGHGASSFIHAVNQGRAVEISENNGGFWLEFWEKTEDEDAAPVNEMTVASCEKAVEAAMGWLQ